jgi:uncharacterized protein (TIGR03790 family)
MKCLRWGTWILPVWVLFAFSIASAQGDIGASDVLMVYNQASADSVEVAKYYAQVHPCVHLLGLANVTTSEDITADYYLQNIRPQILSALSPSIDVIVTAKGLPLRISVTETNPSNYTDPFGIARNTSGTGRWKTYSSLESELTQIDKISTWQQMGDQYYASISGGVANPPASKNPFYRQTANQIVPFNYNDPACGGIRLTSRLDGYSVANIKSMIDRATHAVVLPQTSQIVIDDDPVPPCDRMVQLKDNVLTPCKMSFVYDNTAAPITVAPGPVIGYVSHGVHSRGLTPLYLTDQLKFQLAPGAVFETHESFNAYSFQQGGSTMGQGQIAQWLAAGGTVGVGNVQEPGAGLNYEANEDQMFKMLLDGKTWAEAAWSSIRQLSYVNTVIGDPLMTWKSEVNMAVNQTDLSISDQNFSDLNSDGKVDSADLTLLQAYGMDSSNWPTSFGQPIFIPEPSSGILFLMSFAACVAGTAFRLVCKK